MNKLHDRKTIELSRRIINVRPPFWIAMDLDGTVVRVNTFKLWVPVACVHLLATFHLVRLGAMLKSAIERVSGRINSDIMRDLMMQAYDGVPFQESVCTIFARLVVRRWSRWRELTILLKRSSGEFRCVLATAAPGFYARPIAIALGFEDVVASEPRKEPNVGEIKAQRVVSLIGNNPDVFFTDHYDDFPLARLAHRVILVEPNTETRARFDESGVKHEIWHNR